MGSADVFRSQRQVDIEQTGLARFALMHELDIELSAHTELLPLLLEGRWGQARILATELHDVLREGGFQPDGFRVIAGNSWSQPR
jgi:hypothetical protein